MPFFAKSSNKVNLCKQNNEKENSLQLEKQFYKTYRNFLIVSQLFLSAPIGLHKPKYDQQQKNKIPYRLHIVWCLSIYSLFAFCVYNEYTLSIIQLPTVQKPLYFSEYLVYLIHILEFMRMTTYCRELFWKFQIFILNFDGSLNDLKIRVQYDDLKRFLRQHAFLIMLHFITCVIIGYFYNDCKVLNFLLTNTVYILPNVIINISLVQYYALLFIIYKRGEQLYIILDKLLSTSSTNDICNFRQQLNLMRSLFAKLDEFTKRVNDHFSISICLVYFGSFVNISVNLFLLYTHLNAWSTKNLAWTIYSVAWACMHIGKMFLILYYNQKVQNVLRLFILQLMSDTRSNYVCGILALNMNFITSLLVAISTLFIFLVQYDITYDALSITHNSHGSFQT